MNDPGREVINIFRPVVHISSPFFRFSSKFPRNNAISEGFFHPAIEKKSSVFVTFPKIQSITC